MADDTSWRGELRARMTGRLLLDEPAEAHTSIGVGGTVDALCFPQSEDELAGVVAFLGARGVPFLAVGNWTNLIVTSGGYRGALISTTALRMVAMHDEADGSVRLEAQAGVPLADLVNLAQRESFAGMEFCAGIPGSVGGAVRMNAGAYGGEIKDVCSSVRLVGPEGGIRSIGRADLVFHTEILTCPQNPLSSAQPFLCGGERGTRSPGASGRSSP